MDENKLVSGGIIFALSSLATLSYHNMMNKNNRKKNKKTIKKMKPIIEVEENDGYIPSTNTPISNSIEELNPITQTLTVQEESKLIIHDNDIKIIKTFEPPNNTNTNTMSSFFELNNTCSLTNTEELEFTKLDSIQHDCKIYGTPTLKLINKNNYRGYSSEREEYGSDSDDVEVTYYSEGELIKNKNKLFKYFKRKKFKN